MKSTTPKVLSLLHGKPLIQHIVEHVEAAGAGKPVIVVPKTHTKIQESLGERARYVVQAEPLGTGHAVLTTESVLRGEADHVVVLYGDMPFLSPMSIRSLIDNHLRTKAIVTMLTAETPDFTDWRAAFQMFGRIVRTKEGNLRRIVEWKDASPEELQIRELSTCYFCFDAGWLWSHIPRLGNRNNQGQYYLTDLMPMAIEEGARISLFSVPLEEVMGVNTPDDLRLAHDLGADVHP